MADRNSPEWRSAWEQIERDRIDRLMSQSLPQDARIRADQEARRAQIIQAEGIGPRLGPAPLGGMTDFPSRGLVEDAPFPDYPPAPSLGRDNPPPAYYPDTDEIMRNVFELQEQDRSRSGGVRRSSREKPASPVGDDMIPPTQRSGPRGRQVDTRGLYPGQYSDEELLPPRPLPESAGLPDTIDDTKSRPPKAYEKSDSTIGVEGSGSSGPVRPRSRPAGLVPSSNPEIPRSGEQAAVEEDLNFLQEFARNKLGMDEGQRADLARALIMGGAAAMAGDSPYAMQNIGEGIMAGADEYYGAREERRTAGLEEEAMRMERELHQMNMQNLAQQIRDGELSIEQAELELKQLAEGVGPAPDELVDFDHIVNVFLNRNRDNPDYTQRNAEDMALRLLGKKVPEIELGAI